MYQNGHDNDLYDACRLLTEEPHCQLRRAASRCEYPETRKIIGFNSNAGLTGLNFMDCEYPEKDAFELRCCLGQNPRPDVGWSMYTKMLVGVYASVAYEYLEGLLLKFGDPAKASAKVFVVHDSCALHCLPC